MTHLSKLAIGAIAVALVAAGAGVGYAIGHNDVEKGVAAGRTKTTALGARLESSTTTSTSTTLTSSGSTSNSTSTANSTSAVQTATPGARQSTPTTSVTPQQTTAVTSRTATATAGGVCGTGSASAAAKAKTAPLQANAGTDYRTDVSVDVVSRMDRAIELDRIVITLDYSDGSADTHAFGVAGTTLQPGQSRTFSASYVTHRPPSGVSLADFAWHTAGQPQCPGRAA